MFICLSKQAKGEYGDGIVTPRSIKRYKERLAILL